MSREIERWHKSQIFLVHVAIVSFPLSLFSFSVPRNFLATCSLPIAENNIEVITVGGTAVVCARPLRSASVQFNLPENIFPRAWTRLYFVISYDILSYVITDNQQREINPRKLAVRVSRNRKITIQLRSEDNHTIGTITSKQHVAIALSHDWSNPMQNFAQK